jgi:hypothetical protein
MGAIRAITLILADAQNAIVIALDQRLTQGR